MLIQTQSSPSPLSLAMRIQKNTAVAIACCPRDPEYRILYPDSSGSQNSLFYFCAAILSNSKIRHLPSLRRVPFYMPLAVHSALTARSIEKLRVVFKRREPCGKPYEVGRIFNDAKKKFFLTKRYIGLAGDKICGTRAKLREKKLQTRYRNEEDVLKLKIEAEARTSSKFPLHESSWKEGDMGEEQLVST